MKYCNIKDMKTGYNVALGLDRGNLKTLPPKTSKFEETKAFSHPGNFVVNHILIRELCHQHEQIYNFGRICITFYDILIIFE